jgi:hypothetical protein
MQDAEVGRLEDSADAKVATMLRTNAAPGQPAPSAPPAEVRQASSARAAASMAPSTQRAAGSASPSRHSSPNTSHGDATPGAVEPNPLDVSLPPQPQAVALPTPSPLPTQSPVPVPVTTVTVHQTITGGTPDSRTGSSTAWTDSPTGTEATRSSVPPSSTVVTSDSDPVAQSERLREEIRQRVAHAQAEQRAALAALKSQFAQRYAADGPDSSTTGDSNGGGGAGARADESTVSTDTTVTEQLADDDDDGDDDGASSQDNSSANMSSISHALQRPHQPGMFDLPPRR